jgi:hypothetical protein
MKRNIIFKIVAALVLVGAVLALGAFAFRAGVAQGLAMDPQQLEGGRFPAVPYMHYGRPVFGFGGFLIPLFLILLAFSAIRALVWSGPRRWHYMHGHWGTPHMAGYGSCDRGVPPMFAEWHRRAHAQESGAEAKTPETGEDAAQ